MALVAIHGSIPPTRSKERRNLSIRTERSQTVKRHDRDRRKVRRAIAREQRSDRTDRSRLSVPFSIGQPFRRAYKSLSVRALRSRSARRSPTAGQRGRDLAEASDCAPAAASVAAKSAGSAARQIRPVLPWSTISRKTGRSVRITGFSIAMASNGLSGLTIWQTRCGLRGIATASASERYWRTSAGPTRPVKNTLPVCALAFDSASRFARNSTVPDKDQASRYVLPAQ